MTASQTAVWVGQQFGFGQTIASPLFFGTCHVCAVTNREGFAPQHALHPELHCTVRVDVWGLG